MGYNEGSVALLKQGSESCNTLHKPGLVVFWVSEEEGLFCLDDGGGKIGVRGKWGIGIVGIAQCFADVLLELPFCLFLLKEAAVDKRGVAVLLSEKGVLTTQVCPAPFFLVLRAFFWDICGNAESNMQGEVVTVSEWHTSPAIFDFWPVCSVVPVLKPGGRR
eukprot:12753748-Ditylum_brightwellii.AAC.1